MPGQIVLQWTVDTENTPLSAAAAATRLGAVDLYVDDETDPVLGQLFGLTVDSDVTDAPSPTQARRTLTLNMDAQNSPTAPPPFPCHPRTSTPPVLPYPLREAVTLPGSFFLTLGSTSVPTTMTQLPSLVAGDSIQFLSQPGVFYVVAVAPPITSTTITLTAAYTGTTGPSEAFKEIPAPVALDRLAIFSTSEHDTGGVATTPVIPVGSGAPEAELQYNDSTGAGPFNAEAQMTGKRPAGFVFEDPAGIDVAEIVFLAIDAGAFGNSVGQITLVELSGALPTIPTGIPIGTGRGMIEGASEAIGITGNTFKALTDEAQLLITRSLVYLPPSYYALAQQGADTPRLAGDFLVTTGSTNVPTTVDQTAALAATDTMEFAAQPGVLYEVAAVTAKIVTLTTAYTGVDDNFTGDNESAKVGTKGNIGPKVINKLTGAVLVSPSPAAPPTEAQLGALLGQLFLDGQVAAPPPGPPFLPAPTVLSGYFTRTLQLALAGIPVVPATITFA